MTLAANGPRKTARTHDEIYRKVEHVEKEAEDAARRSDLNALTLQRVEKKLDDVIRTVGSTGEDGDGQLHGTGLMGAVLRLTFRVDDRFRKYDRWAAIVVGFVAAFLPLSVVVWWLVEHKLEGLLR